MRAFIKLRRGLRTENSGITGNAKTPIPRRILIMKRLQLIPLDQILAWILGLAFAGRGFGPPTGAVVIFPFAGIGARCLSCR